MAEPWYRNVYRRNVVDMHITDDDPRFMAGFDAQAYVEMLVRAQVQSAVVYAHSHAGLCFYPTKVGAMHRNLKGRNIVAEVADLCHQNKIAVVIYYSLIFDTWAYRTHPDWRIVMASGEGAGDHSRYGVCCPNSPYREHVAAIVEEICRNLPFEGIRFDMTFWPQVCYCRHCRERFAREVGGKLPQVMDWEDPLWVSFQRRREAWLVDFAALATSVVRKLRPDATVEHQASTYPLGWRFGVTTALAPQNDFLQGDFYGDALQGSFARKLFHNLTPNRPAGFETSIGVDLHNYTALKSPELLTCKAHAALADASAFVFIDSIDPTGMLNPAVYERMGRIFGQTQAYEPYLGGELCQDVGVFLSTESKYDPADKGKRVDDPHLSARMPHVEAAVSACKSLLDSHIPFGVITRRNLADLQKHSIIILPNVLMMDAEEAAALREYVRAGGNLYASRYTSLTTKDGRRQPDFLLADVLGVAYQGETAQAFTYIAPTPGADPVFGDYASAFPLGLDAPQVLVKAQPGAQVLGETVLPYTDPADPQRFASIHNNPPGIRTGHPAVVLNAFGQGKALYVSGDLESADPARAVFINLLQLLARPFSFQAAAPKAVEVTLFHQAERRRFIITLLNFQKELPNIPVEGARVRVRLDSKIPRRLTLLPAGQPLPYEVRDGYVEFVAPRVETFLMLALAYGD